MAGAPHSIAALLRWFGTLELLSFACFALTLRLTALARDRGFALAKLLAWLAPGSIVWFAASTGLAANSAGTARTVAGVLLAAGLAEAWRSRGTLRDLLTSHARPLLLLEGSWCAVFALFTLVRVLKPAIAGGERPMDFAILNACLRAATFPPADPWFAGSTLNYYYFGHALTAVFTQLTGVGAAMAFSLALPTLAALLATLVCAAVLQVTGRPVAALFAVVLVVFAGNLDGLRMFLSHHPPYIDSGYFWQTSRVIAGTVTEYPFYSLMLGDLHAHVFVMPLSAGLLYLGCLWQAPSAPVGRGVWALCAALAAWLLGAVSATSAWSLPSMAGLTLGFLLISRGPGRRRVRDAGAAVLALAVIIGAAFLLFQPFWSRYLPSGLIVTMAPGHDASALDATTVFGVFLGLALLPLGSIAWRRWSGAGPGSALLAAAAVAALLGYFHSGASGVYAAWCLLAVSIWLSDARATRRVGAMLCAAACGLGLVTEFLTVADRMNTVFKYYLDMWLMLGPGVAILLAAVWEEAGPEARRVWVGAAAAITLTGLFTTVTGVYGFYRSPVRNGDTPTLDGLQFLGKAAPAEREAYTWLNREVPGAPVMLEAQGESYGDFSRVSMNTGLPTILGWSENLLQQGRPRVEVERRIGDVRRIYEAASSEEAAALLQHYNVAFIMVGPLERQAYSAAGLALLALLPDFEPVFRNEGVTIYAARSTGPDQSHTLRPANASGRLELTLPDLRDPRPGDATAR